MKELLSNEDYIRVQSFLNMIGGKPILIHSQGNSSGQNKNLNHSQELDLYDALLSETTNPIVVLDWDRRVARIPDKRFFHIPIDFKLSLPELWLLYTHSALLIAIDSGPYHFARMTDIPVLGLWTRNHPAKYALPRDRTFNLVSPYHTGSQLTALRGDYFNVVESDLSGCDIACNAVKILEAFNG